MATSPVSSPDQSSAPSSVRPSPLLSLPGAVAAEAPDEGVAAHYGDPLREQRRLAEGRGFVDLSHRGVVRVSGPDRLSWLHSLTTQYLTGLKPGEATLTLVLSPHGHIEHAMYAVDDGEALWAHVEPGTAPALVAFLDRMRFLLRVEVEDVTDAYAVVFEPVPEPLADAAGPPARVTADGRELFLPRADLAAFGAEHADPAGMWAYEALRIAAHRPRVGNETDHRTIVHEVGWIDTAVHLDKGCYRGQETVARVQNLGRPPRRLVFLHLDGTEEKLPATGAPVELDGRPVGFVTSAARHHELGTIALALIKRNTAVDAVLRADGVPASQEVVVPA
ncbi:folate-binding protein [Yinghuangia sp. ASG 101]|uniref:CAF17-like 4Fe-4S cluster assembly/insertion protein YgfZ n=1 Tax=Yinghuangia sp. ASG 101 TaxID=2896848 RepID=UPI001E5AE226|nr:glycine cleavage T C-terminal barrel domain-containing protein [Yinghuangia sp. ASG 101]UGQ14906.1 folate-binding protein [Yinghuangia sp. ASG 101]